MAASAEGPKGATPITEAQNRAVLDALPFGDTQDFEDARRGFLGSLPEVEIVNEQGRVVWSLRDYAFLAGQEAPPTVNPSLWRQARLNMHHGLFQVAERIYQVRGFRTTDTRRRRLPSGSRCQGASRERGMRAATTGRSATMPRRSISAISAGTMPIPRA